jgi:hypothetical protein
MLGMKLGMFPPDPGVRDSTTASTRQGIKRGMHMVGLVGGVGMIRKSKKTCPVVLDWSVDEMWDF